MISKHEIQHVRALSVKKHRDESCQFVAEGMKVVGDLLPLMSPQRIYVTDDGWTELKSKAGSTFAKKDLIARVTEKEMERLSFLKTPRNILALFAIPQHLDSLSQLSEIPGKQLCLALDGVQDPGNVGTILRIADWFGIEHVFASPDTADIFSPKVVQATMGAIGRVNVHYLPLREFLLTIRNDIPLYGTFLDGDNVYNKKLSETGIIVMGNEGNGISTEIRDMINQRLFIPNYPLGRLTSESLNVAVATAVVCAEFRRRLHK